MTRPDSCHAARSIAWLGVLLALLLVSSIPAGAQERIGSALEADNPLLPRGTVLFEIRPANLHISGLYGNGSAHPLGDRFFLTSLGPDQLPVLAETETRYRELIGEGSSWILDLGGVGGRMEADEQVIPVRVGYGLIDRVSLGVTVPFVRRRISSTLGPRGTGATAGENPLGTDPEGVAQFLTAAEQALSELAARVAEVCDADPEMGDPPTRLECEDGEALLARASGFLLALETAYDEEIVFPLRGSSGAAGLDQRWEGFRGELAGWEVESPDGLPMARLPISDATFAAHFVDPAWGGEGFPRDLPEELMAIGDVEAHLVLGLIQSGGEGEGLRIRSSLVASARFPTGAPDSLQALVPYAPPRGVSAAGLRLVADVVSSTRFAVLGVAEGWWHGEGETVLLAPDPDRVLGDDAVTRAAGRWRPGPTFRVRVVPRGHLTPSLSLGAGYEMSHRGAHEFDVPGLPNVRFPGTEGASTVHSLRGEFRFHGFEEPMIGGLPFPLEVMLAYGGTVSGSGPFAPRERRVELGVRVLRGR